MRSFLLATQFLTVLPISVDGEVTESDLRRSMFFYPVVGLLLGSLLALTYKVLSFFYPLPLTLVLTLTFSVLLTGGLHLDGLSDFCDGLYAGKTREERLTVMKDPHIGAIGVISLLLLFSLKISGLLSLPPSALMLFWVLMPVLGRSSLVVACRLAPYARAEGTGSPYIGRVGKFSVLFAILASLLLCLILLKGPGLILFIVQSAFLLFFIAFCKSRLGGVTGDSLGALSEMSEVLVLLVSTALRRFL